MSKPIIQVRGKAPETATGLVERTMHDLRQLIRDKHLIPGDILPSEATLADDLAVSRTVAREALRGLATLRIIDVGNGRRARVATANADALSMILDHTVYTGQLSIQQILDVRRTLELRTARLAALRRSDADMSELMDLVTRMFEALDNNSYSIMEYDIRYHEVIARASGNALYSILINSFRVITRQTWAIGWRSRTTEESRLENIRCHERIAAAIFAQDPVHAEVMMSEHFDSAVAALLRAGVN